MNYRGHQSPGYGYQNSQQRNFSTVSPQHQQLGGWGAPARGFSPNPNVISPRGDRTFHSRSPMSSPRHSSPYHTPNTSQRLRYSSPGDRRFKTPNSPFSPPGSRGKSQRGSGRKQNFNRSFYQTPRQDRNCNPGGSSQIEDYYHASMLDDPWKFCSPVSVTKTPSMT